MLCSSFILVGLCSVAGLVQATSYTLQDDYTDNFFDMFNFFTGPDPTSGWTDYLTYDNATASGLIKSTNPPKWGVDDNNVIDPSNNAGRPSVRLTSQKTYNHGLFVLDLAHMPSSVCGVWPAFWSFGQSATWPAGGEIDIIEFVNNHDTDLMTLHTADGCSIAGDSSLMTGELESNVCDVSQGNGCSISDNDSNSAGTGFNNIGGGVYAMEWTSELIQIWFFHSGSVPSSITSGTPDTSDFGEPVALFQGSCDIDSHFYDHAIIFDLTFCGAWAGTTYQDDGCPMTSGQDSAASCITYVGENPTAYVDAYWEVNSLKVYSADTSSDVSSASAGTSATPAASTASLALTSQSAALGASTSSLVARSTSSSVSVSSASVTTSSPASTSSAEPTSTASASSTGYTHWHHGPPSRRHARPGHLNW